MPPPDRTVRQLRLRATGEASVRRLMPTLEDALRCASLGDDGARLIVVRKLALGSVAAGVSSQALSRLIETRTAASVRQAVAATADDAELAACVVFAGALEARMLLSSRLVRGAKVDAWYWPLAVREFDAGLPWRLNLVRIGAAVARTPEGRVALPRWTAALVHAVGPARVAACIDEIDGERLLSLAGLDGHSRDRRGKVDPDAAKWRTPSRPRPSDDAARAKDATRSSRIDANATPLPNWLHRLLDLAGALAVGSGNAGFAEGRRSNGSNERDGGDGSDWSAEKKIEGGRRSKTDGRFEAAMPMSKPTSMPTRSRVGRAGFEDGLDEVDRDGSTVSHEASNNCAGRPVPSPAHGESPSRAALGRDPTPPATREEFNAREEDSAADAASLDAASWLQPTNCGGLLFLLPVLARLGFPQRAADGQSAVPLTAAVLRIALRRAHAPTDDPMWRLADSIGAGEASDAGDAGDADDADDEEAAALALADARRWLHRAGRLGLVRLVRRPARMSLTGTHVDVHFTLGQCELRVRRLGLDLDPGWVPWFGRVVAFHYGARDA